MAKTLDEKLKALSPQRRAAIKKEANELFESGPRTKPLKEPPHRAQLEFTFEPRKLEDEISFQKALQTELSTIAKLAVESIKASKKPFASDTHILARLRELRINYEKYVYMKGGLTDGSRKYNQGTKKKT